MFLRMVGECVLKSDSHVLLPGSRNKSQNLRDKLGRYGDSAQLASQFRQLDQGSRSFSASFDVRVPTAVHKHVASLN